MPIRVLLDGVLARRGRTARDIAAEIGLSQTQLSLFRSGKVRGIRFGTLARLCRALDCSPGDLLGYTPDPDDLAADDPAAEDPD
jgi:putative transcriptional regulator